MSQDINSFIQRRREAECLYENLSTKERNLIDKKVYKRLQPILKILEPEIRFGNGIEKAIDREKKRLIVEETVLNKKDFIRPIPGIENSDGLHPGMVFIPSGKCTVGADHGFMSREEPSRIKNIPGFWIDIYPITNSQYHALYNKHAPDPHSKEEDMPVVNVTWYDAAKFCAALGKRLPTQEEWEKAARGPENWIYSFGNEFDKLNAHIWPAEGTAKVSMFKPNPWGLYQMSGNIWEWTSNIYCHRIKKGQRILYNLARGGSWRHCMWGARTTISICLDLAHRSENVGFRCVCSY